MTVRKTKTGYTATYGGKTKKVKTKKEALAIRKKSKTKRKGGY